ncbi:MAG: HEAT repeat domain-containing protein [Gemmataceae bacterium]|nr:HEAT repeat domain-containing protein [Gemmataceae bacterium]
MRSGDDARNVQGLIEKLQDPQQVVRLHAATVLGTLGDAAAAAVPVLVAMLEAGDVHDRRLAALTLGEIGPAAEQAIPTLCDAVDDEDEGVVELAVSALEAIDPTDVDEEAA